MLSLINKVSVVAVVSPQAPSKDAVRDVCVQSHKDPNKRLTETTAATFSISASQAAQVTHYTPLHTYTHLYTAAYRYFFTHTYTPETCVCVFIL